jgi:arylsulfatase A-like enzyme
MRPALSLLAALLLAPLAALSAAGAQRQPNILVILADDLGYGELGCYGGKDAPTPNLDAMAKAGVRFTSGYVTCPVCSPTRAGLLTGKYQQRFGHENNIGQSWELEHPELMGLPVEEQTIADRLKAAGYRTACIGKWHLGAHENFHPQKRGFDEFFGFLEGGRAYLSDDDPGNFFFKSTPPFKEVHFKEAGKAPIYRGHEIVAEKEYLTDAFTREALRFMDAKTEQPFFLYLAYNAVHTPITPCARWEAKLRHIENPVRRAVASMMAAMDEDIGKLRAHLRERGIADNTLVIFLSDNGGSPGGHNTQAEAGVVNYSLNKPLRGFKGECWEGGVRIPYIVEWPGRVKAGVTSDHAVSSLDMVPTALAAAGVARVELTDGVNLLPFLDGTQSGAPHEKLFWRFHIYKAARKGSLKLIKQRDKADELYDLAADISETKNLAAEKPELVVGLNKELAAWESQMIAPRWNQIFPMRPDGKPLFPRPAAPALTKGPKPPSVSLRENLLPSPIRDVAAGSVTIAGQALAMGEPSIRVRVTTSLGTTFETQTKAKGKSFACRFPQDFIGAPPLSSQLLYVDATDAAEFGGKQALEHQAEALLIVTGKEPGAWPDLPQVFTDDFIDASGKKDTQCAQWQRQHALINLFYRSRAAKLMLMQRPEFDLARPGDLALFKEHATLYDFDHRDRDWSQPLGQRVARGFWQAVWNRWFNASNDHPWDGNPANRDPKNYRPYTFANDAADLLVLYQLRPQPTPPATDNRVALASDVLATLLAMQHRGTDNFALKEATGRQEHYTAGAFRYGMFETGEWLTEGKGWFANPAFRDFARGGVLNGRCVWALGEALKADPHGVLAPKIREALPLALRFCLHDGLERGYTKLTKSGRALWAYPGEHGYLLMGMIAAAEVAPDLPVKLADDEAAKPLKSVCVEALDALTEITKPDGTWSHYANVDAVNLAALAVGARAFRDDAGAARWKSAAGRAADVWLALKPLPGERTTPTPLFGHRKDSGMTFYLGKEPHPHMALYVQGHWLHALADLYAVTRERRYGERAEAILAYYCGDNPLHVRVLNELGAVNNRITDADNDGVEDEMRWNAYPESTAFVQIGLLHLLSALPASNREGR